MNDEQIQHGKIVRLVPEKFYGFVQYSGRTTFFHGTNCLQPFDQLEVGDKVQFSVKVDSRSGRDQAYQLSKIEVS